MSPVWGGGGGGGSNPATTNWNNGGGPGGTLNTPQNNGANRRTVLIVIDLTNTATAKAYAGFSTVMGGTTFAIADVVGLPASAAIVGTERFSFTFAVDPGASYQVTTDLGSGAAATLRTFLSWDE